MSHGTCNLLSRLFFLGLAGCAIFGIVASVPIHVQDNEESSGPESYSVAVDSTQVVGRVSDSFLGFTTDWWTYGSGENGVKWDHSGLDTLALTAPLANLMRQLNRFTPGTSEIAAPGFWRIGGTPQDTVVYDLGDPPECNATWSLGPYPDPICLNMTRWEEIMSFANDTGAMVLFGINALYGRANSSTPMNLTNAQLFLQHNAAHHYPIYAYSFGNENGNGDSTEWVVQPATYASDMKAFSAMVTDIYTLKGGDRPLVVGPDDDLVACDLECTEVNITSTEHYYWCMQNCSSNGYAELVFPLIADSINASTYHMYLCNNEDAWAPDLATNSTGIYIMESTSDGGNIALESAYGLPVWASEVGPFSGGGLNLTSNRYVDAFWYLDHLGYLATQNVQHFARSTFTGADYELVAHETYTPNPDWFAAVLWQRLMGSTTYAVEVEMTGGNSGNTGTGTTAAFSQGGFIGRDQFRKIKEVIGRASSSPSSVPNGAGNLRVYAFDQWSTDDTNTNITLLMLNNSPNESVVEVKTTNSSSTYDGLNNYSVSADVYFVRAAEAFPNSDVAQIMNGVTQLWTDLVVDDQGLFNETVLVPLSLEMVPPLTLTLTPYSYAFVVMRA